MNRDLTDYRKSYDKKALEENELPVSPFLLFSNWFKEVEEAGGVEETNAMSLTTFGLDSYPKTRIVLLKHFDEEGFVFYTNYESEKGKAMAANNKVCISFFWPNLERQVIIKGVVNRISEQKSSDYFNSRPRGSQLGAWASEQSSIVESRVFLESKLLALEEKYKEKEIPKPDFWGGYCVTPVEFEFWQGRPNRLHDRIRYAQQQKGNNWVTNRLSP
ncbi:pyridoxamine 5'-phosphate oxidase [Aquimarina sp. AD1]|uniref:pyridoxamine 5'-phosphate oxidase n=1 Tax=Aquimarina sp. (strain AD1) TaxID=1714848 RepID=UPI000E4C8ED0|nr:pyridoxamine 5'-phosphate oxidase [Aquimarina sp. AD1]AXT55451.1 pyridoxamine 5'-phosphate oxidase [Aquimarina sp. AD1]RKN16275.1 pyridoxamine 5'-phosphate oxidase [Aquimarina sp. AD1]